MSGNNPLDGLPVNGVFPLQLSPAFVAALAGKGGKEDVIGMKYAFKPESITPETEGRLDMNKGRASQLTFDTKKGSQVFDVRDETAAQRECVIVWNPETVSFTIHALPTTLNLTLNRNLSGQPPIAAPVQAKRKAEPAPTRESPKKKSRPSFVESVPERKPTGGKSLPKKNVGKKSIPVTNGKVKSAEIIESEDEDGDDNGEGDGDGDDDFAALLGAEMAKGEDEEEVPVDYDDSESGEEDDDFEL